MLPGMQSAFIDIGLGTHRLPACRRHLERTPQRRRPQTDRAHLAESPEHHRAGAKGPARHQGARLSTQVSIAGRMLVYLPQGKHHPQRIGDETEREQLRERLAWYPRTSRAASSCAPWPNPPPTQSCWPTSDLRKIWAKSAVARWGPFRQVLLPGPDPRPARAARDLVGDETGRIRSTREENFQKLTAFAEEYMPRCCHCSPTMSAAPALFDLYGVGTEIEKALARRVDLKSAVTSSWTRPRAMTTVNVNTGGFVGACNFDDTIFKTNLEAAQTIARQLRLRNLGSIIIVDFIDAMESVEHRDAVLDGSSRRSPGPRKMACRASPGSGLVEMTRKRTRRSLAHLLCESCPPATAVARSKTRAPYATRSCAGCCATFGRPTGSVAGSRAHRRHRSLPRRENRGR